MKTAVSVTLGAILLIAGIALLVLPGPGFVLIAAGLALLATRFDWAKKPLDYAKGKAQQGVEEVRDSKVKAGLALLCAVGLVVFGILGVAGVKLPFINVASAVLLILGGLFLVGTVVYARMQQDKVPNSLI